MRGLAGVIALLLLGLPASAARTDAVPRVRGLATPVGVQGAAGAGASVPIAFRISDRLERPAGVEFQYGIDADGDGRIEAREYRAATEDASDPRSTRGNDGGLFASARGRGAANVLVWRSRTDLVNATFVRQARRARPRGADLGVRVRLRTIGEDGRRSAWVVSRPFSVDNGLPPDVRIDGAYRGRVLYVGPAWATEPVEVVVEIDWRAFDADSEDADGDGTLGPGEDRDGDGVLDAPQLRVDFWYHEATRDELRGAKGDPAYDASALDWRRCPAARFPFEDPAPAVGTAAPGDGASAHVFEWQAKAVLWPPVVFIPEEPPPERWFFLRADPVDAAGRRGPTRYLLTTLAQRPQ